MARKRYKPEEIVRSRFIMGERMSSPASMAYWTLRSWWARQTCQSSACPCWAPSRSETQTAGRRSPKIPCGTFLPRLGSMTWRTASLPRKTHSHQFRPSTRAEVSSEQTMGLSRTRWLDGGRLFVEARLHPFEQIGQRPFADGHPEDVPEQGGQPLETAGLAMVQVDRQGLDRGAEGRAGLQTRRRRRERLPAMGAGAAMKADLGDDGLDRRVRQGGEDAQAPPIHGTRSERHRLSRAVGAPSRLPDGVTELRCPAKRVGQEDRVGEEAEEAGTEEGVTAVSTSTPTSPRKKASACAGWGGSRREGT